MSGTMLLTPLDETGAPSGDPRAVAISGFEMKVAPEAEADRGFTLDDFDMTPRAWTVVLWRNQFSVVLWRNPFSREAQRFWRRDVLGETYVQRSRRRRKINRKTKGWIE